MNLDQTKVLKTIIQPFQRFFSIEASSGILLITATIVAMIWANSRWSDHYFNLINGDLTIQVGSLFKLSKPLILWVNDGLMGIFFFVVGLEIKREVMIGELSSLKQASLPIFAAVGGMLIPAVLFIMLHGNQPGHEGWGVPMATDIAFSLGILSLLGKRVPVSLKIFLTAFAIADDLGAVLVIAFFYSSQIYWNMILIAMGIYVFLWILMYLGLRNWFVFFLLGSAVWYYFLKSGIHPSFAGVLLALIVPVGRKIRVPAFSRLMRQNLDVFCEEECEDQIVLTKDQISSVDNMEQYIESVQSPLQNLEHRMHGFVSYFVMPVFALGNAGIILSGGEGSLINPLTMNIAIALLLGKVTGIIGFSWLGIKLKLAVLPDKARWIHITGLGLLGGVGFTMSLFIAGLAYYESMQFLTQAKIGIILGSLIAGISAFLLLRFSLRPSASNHS